MLRHLLKQVKLPNKSEYIAVRTRALSKTFSKRHNEYTSFRMLASNDGTFLATKSCVSCFMQ